MLRILANENVPEPVIAALRERGHDVAWIAEDQPGADDRTVLARAQQERRLLVTFDTDFGQLAFQSQLAAECGIVLLRLSGPSPSVDNDRAVAALESRADWTGEFCGGRQDPHTSVAGTPEAPVLTFGSMQCAPFSLSIPG